MWMTANKKNIIEWCFQEGYILAYQIKFEFWFDCVRIHEIFDQIVADFLTTRTSSAQENFQRKCDALQDDLKSYNLGSYLYKQNDNMLDKKRNKWRRFDNCRLSREFAKLRSQTRPPTRISKQDELQIVEAKKWLGDWVSISN